MNSTYVRTATEEKQLKMMVDQFKGDPNLMKIVGIAWLSYTVIYQFNDLKMLEFI